MSMTYRNAIEADRAAQPSPVPARPTLLGLLRASGGRRYAVALAVDSLGAGLLRPFLLLYGITVLGMSVVGTGAALSIGMLAGLGAVPVIGWWIDRGARTVPVAATLLVRVIGVGLLLAASGPVGFTVASVLLGIGNQAWPPAHAAVVTSLAEHRTRDAALAVGRSVRNAGLGAGALIATVAAPGGPTALRVLAAFTVLGYLVAAALVWSMRVSVKPLVPPRRDTTAGDPGELSRITALCLANLPYALCFGVLEVALPVLVVTHLHASPSWSAGMFVGNTVLVITTQVPVVIWLARYSRRSVLASSGLVLALSYVGFWVAGAVGGSSGAVAVAAVSVLYTAGEILYAEAGTALVAATAPPHQLGRALARWQLSNGLGLAAAPAILTVLMAVGPGLMWAALIVSTLLAAEFVRRWAPADRVEAAQPVLSAQSVEEAAEETTIMGQGRLRRRRGGA